ncbi:hypothetical protein G3I40_09060 [Streptomyces sp. SID14478]|uniref:hypothetical protein n=1 Tax=Streptomyces sp. SID14478 TaxID=2706073 RepID=UPI0013D90C45|nr:hypothetical protein [Streptomyces sp. SID14478]NEB75375.1 hypothetical protein [Streptomyces sp. SID14478]
MTTYVITVPGTFLRAPDDGVKADIVRRLRPSDPHHTELGREEDLDVLTVHDDNTFSARLEVAAETSRDAEAKAVRSVEETLRAAGLEADAAPLGPPAVTGMDNPA